KCGRGLMEAIVNTGKTLTLNQASDLSGISDTQFDLIDDAQESPSGTPGRGSNASIRYNLGRWGQYDGSEPWMKRPPAISLGHELVHAWRGMSGTLARKVGARESQAIGLGEFANAPFSENRFREQLGL